MKLLLKSDLHSDRLAIEDTIQRAADVDVVVIAGDLCVMRRGLTEVVSLLSQIQTPTIVVPGNAESDDELKSACEKWLAARVLHGSGAEIDGVHFFGLGAAVPETPFGSWSFDLSEQAATELLADCPTGAVLVTHSPPKGAGDRSSAGKSLGSQAVRNLIEDRPPRLVVCGHIHESWGSQMQLGQTWVVNAGPEGLIWEL